ncbi:hypothetical protein GJ699_05115 [Duganella sp. FT80W]|uniref:Uncharacterized protein n=1 Tax=Duganella guangzhouensis TaxID=2666084 RepID=A0A6I2KTS6_9BURK|nr:hypothetical protein [Duganella guangzhouensis]MRW89355.1 hypothetical protein [Duganella guangzhouensis]
MRKDEHHNKWMPSPYFEQLSEEITFRLDFRSIEYFEEQGRLYGLPAQDMIAMYLRHMAGSGYKANLGIMTLKEREELKARLEQEGMLPRKT